MFCEVGKRESAYRDAVEPGMAGPAPLPGGGFRFQVDGTPMYCRELGIGVPTEDKTGQAPFALRVVAFIPRTEKTVGMVRQFYQTQPVSDTRDRVLRFLDDDVMARKGSVVLSWVDGESYEGKLEGLDGG